MTFSYFLFSFFISFLQIIFDGFTVGRFDEGLVDNDFDTTDASLITSTGELPGCPDGFMQVRVVFIEENKKNTKN